MKDLAKWIVGTTLFIIFYLITPNGADMTTYQWVGFVLGNILIGSLVVLE